MFQMTPPKSNSTASTAAGTSVAAGARAGRCRHSRLRPDFGRGRSRRPGPRDGDPAARPHAALVELGAVHRAGIDVAAEVLSRVCLADLHPLAVVGRAAGGEERQPERRKDRREPHCAALYRVYGLRGTPMDVHLGARLYSTLADVGDRLVAILPALLAMATLITLGVLLGWLARMVV